MTTECGLGERTTRSGDLARQLFAHRAPGLIDPDTDDIISRPTRSVISIVIDDITG